MSRHSHGQTGRQTESTNTLPSRPVVSGADSLEACDFDAHDDGSFCNFSSNNWVLDSSSTNGPPWDHTVGYCKYTDLIGALL